MKRLFCSLAAIGMLWLYTRATAQQTFFKAAFSPLASYTHASEKPFRSDRCLNGYWQFAPVTDKALLTPETIQHPGLPQSGSWERVPVKVPSPWNINDFATEPGSGDFITYPSYPTAWNDVKAGWLSHKFTWKQSTQGKRVILHFEAVAGYVQVYVNGQQVKENYEIFLPFETDITDQLKAGRENEILVWVADADLLNQPGKYGRRLYVGGSFWGQHINGIWQDVYLLERPDAYVKDVFIQPYVSKDELQVAVTIRNAGSQARQLTVAGRIAPWINQAGSSITDAPVPAGRLDKAILSLASTPVQVGAGEEKTITLSVKVKGRLQYWAPGHPQLYGLITQLGSQGKDIDKQYNRFGWREFTLKGDQLLLNGQRIVLQGDSWHFMGIPQMTRRYAWAWYHTLQQAGGNAVRLHAQPYPSFYLDMADEMGICVLDETGLWASDGGPKEDAAAYWNNAALHLERMIHRDRNHPAVFGWSVCNENIPVAVHVHHSPDSLVQKQLQEINHWVAITRRLDPSRQWISGDGETDRPTDLPTIIGHYGDEGGYKSWSSQGKVWGIGEAGMAYYGTPRQTAAYNGNLSYISQQRRMEGVAIEAIQILNLQKKYDASYRSVFNLAWYGLQPLPLGLKDTTAAPGPNDGIFFPPFTEGIPGVQPERLGPYTSTFNPGYDPQLPLYRTWPLYDAIRASFTSKEAVTPTWTTEQPALPGTAGSVHRYTSCAVLSADKDSALPRLIAELGITITPVANAQTSLLVVDGAYPPADAATLSLIQAVSRQGGNVLIMGATPDGLQQLQAYLPASLQAQPRKATSFLVTATGTLMDSLDNAAFYLSERSGAPVSLYGLSGDFVNKGRTLLQASNTDWRRWNNQPEYAKTISVIRSERERKAAGNVLVDYPAGQGHIYATTLQPAVLQKASDQILHQLFTNLGVVFNGNEVKNLSVFGERGFAQNTLVAGPLNGFTATLPGTTPQQYVPGAIIQGKTWQLQKATRGGFVLPAAAGNGPAANYISYWIYSPRSLTNLLVEPDMPKLELTLRTTTACRIFVNQALVKETTGGQDNRETTVNALPLEKGWNHLLIQAQATDRENTLSLQLRSNNNNFLQEVKSKIAQ